MEKPTLTNPEGIMMLAIAAFADFVPPIFVLVLDIFFGVGELLSWPLDIFFTAIFGIWMWTRGVSVRRTKGRAGRFLRRRGIWMLGEYIPILGSIAPFWIINTLFFLKEVNRKKITPKRRRKRKAIIKPVHET